MSETNTPAHHSHSGGSASHQSDSSHSHRHHHHHHTHHSSRKRRMRLALKRGLLFGASAIALACLLIILYYGIKDKPNVWALLLRLSPVLLVMGASIVAANYFYALRQYKKEHR